MSDRDPLDGAGPPEASEHRLPLAHEDEVRRRQRSRALVMGLALAAFVVLLYAVTIARIGMQ